MPDVIAVWLAKAFKQFQIRAGLDGKFDVVFHDDENKVVRFSPDTWTTSEDAVRYAAACEARGDRPTHWHVAWSM